MDSDYMKDERAKSIAGFIAALEIMAKYIGMNKTFFLDAEHDVIYSDLSLESCPEDSEDGQLLYRLGWHADEDVECWAYFT